MRICPIRSRFSKANPLPIVSHQNKEPSMSHIVVIETQVRDPIAVRAACERLELEPTTKRTAELFCGSQSGLI